MHPQANSNRALVQRQQFALTLFGLLTSGKRIVNVDETWLNETSFLRRTWARKDGLGNAKMTTVSPRLSLIAAMDTEGKGWFCLTHATTDSNVISLFLKHLC